MIYDQPSEGAKMKNNLDPLKVIGWAALIAAISLILGLIVPALIAHYGGVFYMENMSQIPELVERKSQNPNIILVPFFLNPVMYVWAAMYPVLGWLIFLMPRWEERLKLSSPETGKVPVFKIIAMATGIYIMWEWPLWVRNFVIDKEGRIVHAFANYDVFKPSFFTQEANLIIFAALLAVLWQQWSWFFWQKRKDLAKDLEKNPCDEAFKDSNVELLSKTFVQWQVASLLLAPGFISFSSGYWNLVVSKGDYRYLLSAVMIHVLWGITWMLISLPLLITWYNWRSIRVRALSELSKEPSENTGNVETKLKILAEMQPIGFWNAATSGSLASVTFALPIVQAFVHQ